MAELEELAAAEAIDLMNARRKDQKIEAIRAARAKAAGDGA